MAARMLRVVLRTLSSSRCSRAHRHHWTTAVISQSEAGDHSACWVSQGRGRGGGGVLWAAVAFSLFSSSEKDQRDEAQRKKDDMILLLKKAKLSVQRGQLQAASSFLHQAIALAHQTHNNEAIIYTYIQMANLSYVQGQLDSAEKLFKAAMSFMLAGGTPQDNNAVIEMSLKLATIYAEQSRGTGGSEEGNPSPAGSLFGLSSPVPSLHAGPVRSWTGLPEGPGHLQTGAGGDTPTDSGSHERPGYHPGPTGSPQRRTAADPAGGGPQPVGRTSGSAPAAGKPGGHPAAHRTVGGLSPDVPRGSGSGSAGRGPGGHGQDPGGFAGGEEQKKPGEEGRSCTVT